MLKDKLDQVFVDDYKLEMVVKNDNRLYDFISRGSDTLLITIGDSWTYGAMLESEGNRVNLCFGALVSEQLNIDYLNFSVKGINNTWMVDKFIQLSDIDLGYKNIFVCIVFTEFGRELNTEFDDDSAIHDLYRQSNSARDLAVSLAEYNSDRILKHLKPNTHLMLACNYVSNIYPERIKKYFLPMSWFEVCIDKQLIDECIVVGSWVIPKYQEVLSIYNRLPANKILEEVTKLVDIGQQRLNLIYNSKLNHKSGYGHPNASGHKKWADYIVTNLNTELNK